MDEIANIIDYESKGSIVYTMQIWSLNFMATSRMAEQSRMILGRSMEQLKDLELFISKCRPFEYVFEIDASSGQRSTFPQRNEDQIDLISRRCSEVIASFRIAIEYAYVAVVKPCVDEKRSKAIQFPATPEAEKLEKECKKRLAFEVGQGFVDEIIRLAPHGEEGGNTDLYFICSMDNGAKHGRIVPMGYYAELDGAMVREMIPDFPQAFDSITVGNCGVADVVWGGPSMNIHERILNKVPANGKLHRLIDVPVKISFLGKTANERMHVYESLNDLYAVTEKAVAAILSHHQS